MLLQDIIKEKRFVVKNSAVKWSDAVPLIQQRIDFVLDSIYGEPAAGLLSSGSLGHDDTAHGVLCTLRSRIISNIEKRFDESPPFTVLRLAEVLLDPKETYSTALKFLRALYTITSVTSTHSTFPLDDATETEDTIANGTVVQQSLTGDDSQTVLLTKIDWLTQEDIEEVGSENYMVFEEQAELVVDDPDRDQDPELAGLKTEDDYKKRKVDGESHDQSTPEKKHKLSKEESTEPENGIALVESIPDDHSTIVTQDDNVYTDHSEQPRTTSPEDNMDLDGIAGENSL